MDTQLIGVVLVLLVVVSLPLFAVRHLFTSWRKGAVTRAAQFFLFLCVIEGALMAWGFLVEPGAVSLTHLEHVIPELPRDWTCRIAQLSDLHIENDADTPPRLERALGLVASFQPDLVFLTGDYLNRRNGEPLLEAFVRRLASMAPVLAVPGNWEGFFPLGLDVVQRTGVTVLDGTTRTVEVRGRKIGVIGLPVNDVSPLERLENEVAGANVRVVLTHTPDLIDDCAARPLDLYFCGHTHGGQFRLPWYGAVITLTRSGKKYEAGPYRVGRLLAYTSRGLGMEGAIAPRVRFLCPPEVLGLTLVGGR